MSATLVALSPDQNLLLKTATGWREYSYDHLVKSLESRRPGKSKRSKTHSTKMSRHINLLCRSIKTGTWTTGAPVDKTEASRKLLALLKDLNDDDVAGLTSKAKGALHSIYFEESMPENLAIEVYKAGERRFK